MSLNAALALVPDLHCRERDESLEGDALRRLAGWTLRYSPLVSLGRGPEILLEIQGSLSLFQGLNALCGQVEESLRELGYRVCSAVAPFPEAASLLARGRTGSRITDPAAIPKALGGLPVTVLEPDEKTAAALGSVGVSLISDLMILPQQGLRRRFGQNLVNRLESALGRRSDPRRPWRRPSRFRARLELPSAVHNTEPLLFVVKRLLQELAGVLAAAGRGVENLEIFLHHGRGSSTRMQFGLLQPSRDPDHWLAVLRTRFDATALSGSVESVELRVAHFSELKDVTYELFSDKTFNGENQFMERLKARLGETAVRGLDLVEDYRPERSWRYVSPGTNVCNRVISHRPLWLLRSPLPLASEVEREWRLQDAERIESGWWDGGDVARDYYLAETPRGERLWVFRDLRDRAWYLHGFFS